MGLSNRFAGIFFSMLNLHLINHRMKALFTLVMVMVMVMMYSLLLAQPKKEKTIPTTRILFVFDCSFSMVGKWESGSKMDVSKKILLQTLDSLAKIPNLEVALRMYGHQFGLNPKRNCEDTRLEVPFSKGNISEIKNKIRTAMPKGTTPIAYTLEQCGNDFPDCKDCRNVIILITDGVEECNGDPCAVSAALQSRGIVLRPFVLGIGLDENFRKSFECVGKFFDAANEKSFQTAIGIIISQALNSTTAQVNLLDASGKPTETDVNMTFYDQHTGFLKYNYIHTINHAGHPDTIPIDPLPTYRMVVHTIPPVEKKDIELTPGKHTIIAANTPQGYLNLKAGTTREYKQLQYILRKKGETKTLLVCTVDKPEKLLTGSYDIEILTLPRLYLDNIEISQSKTTTIQIPPPGVANFLFPGSGYGSLYSEEKNELKWIYNFPDITTREMLVLQPGKYRLVYRPKTAKESIYTIERSFIVEPGGTVTVKTN
jgi:Ca-activated chloride channel homolog